MSMLKAWIIRALYRWSGCTGPLMMRCQDDYFYLDGYGRVWRIRPTWDRDDPFVVSLYFR